MLSTISSFLPSALSDKLEKLDLHHQQPGAGQTTQADADDEESGVKRRDMIDEGKKDKEKKKKPKKESTSNETFIVVRPPPAKSNHPLNLQLQLVPAQHTRDRSNTSTVTTPTNSRFSTDLSQGADAAAAATAAAAAQPPPSPSSPSTSETDHGASLQRSVSTRSNRSETSNFYSSAASSGSVTSFASTASTASGRRMIIPLYNLSAHNVMTNTILDAGTDAKVAKFLKRGIEIIGLAILEPIEVWNGDGGAPIRRSPSGNSLVPPVQGGSRSGTPEPSHSPGSSHLSLSSEHSSTPDPAQTSTTPQQHNGAKRMFGRIFRKREASSGGGGGGGGHTPTPSVSAIGPTPAPVPELRAPTMPPPPPRQEILLPPVLGLTPTAAGPPMGRCVAHVWTVRRWLKTDNPGIISGVLGKMGREQEPMEWEVRFEWARARVKGEKRRGTAHTPSRRSSVLVGVQEAHERQGSPRQSLDVLHPPSAARAPSPRRPSTAGGAVSVSSTAPSDEEGAHSAEGDESDPEDSETPWTCTMVLAHPTDPVAPPPTRHRRTRTASSVGVDHTVREPTRTKVASLSPAPHHPKVVCQLKVPFPLPDVEVERGLLHRRVVQTDGSTRSTVPRDAGLVMSAEEIKDVVCSTAFWVVVRQGFGGLGKKNRKGDGWRIRA